MVGVCIPFIYKHIMYILQTEQMWLVFSLTDCFRSLYLALGQKHLQVTLNSGCVTSSKHDVSVLPFVACTVGIIIVPTE